MMGFSGSCSAQAQASTEEVELRHPSTARADFPLLSAKDAPVYLDSAATSQKPRQVLDAMQKFYESSNANVHRGVYELSERATAAFEGARQRIARHIGITDARQLVYTRGTTEAINLVASSLTIAGDLQAGDEILLTVCEHHSNIVPWQMAAARIGAVVRYIPFAENSLRLDMEAARSMVSEKTKVIAFGHVSNVLGIVHPVEELVALAKSVGAITLIDGAQSIPHMHVDVPSLGCDFYAFSGHKAVAPSGIGVLFGKAERLNALPPYQGGGDMISSVTLEGSTWNEIPHKFEAGTPNMAGAIGLAEALDYLSGFDRKACMEHERALGLQGIQALKDLGGFRVFVEDPASDRWCGVVTFAHESIHPHDIAAIADTQGVCIRAGHHCAQPLMQVLKVPATVRMSPFLYNTTGDIERFAEAMREVTETFAG